MNSYLFWNGHLGWSEDENYCVIVAQSEAEAWNLLRVHVGDGFLSKAEIEAKWATEVDNFDGRPPRNTEFREWWELNETTAIANPGVVHKI